MMVGRAVLQLVAAVLCCKDASGGWTTLTAGISVDLRGVAFPSTSVGATHGFVVGKAGALLATTDGGTTWTSQVGTPNDLEAVAFFGTTRGLLVGEKGTALGTTDGGSMWTTQATPSAASNTRLYDVVFTSATDAVTVGGKGLILSTTDGGDTWSTQNSGVSKKLFGVAFPSATHGFVCGKAGTILATVDGGSNWEARPSGRDDSSTYITSRIMNNLYLNILNFTRTKQQNKK